MYKSKDNLNSSRVFLNQAMDSNFNPWKVTNNLSICISLKNGWAKRRKKREAKLRVNNQNLDILTQRFASRSHAGLNVSGQLIGHSPRKG